MSFFNLTMLGHQNKLKDSIKDSGVQSQNALEDQLKAEFASQQMHSYGNGPLGSHSKHKEMNHKHIRNPKQPNEIYKTPVTRAQEIGWWTENDPLARNLQWAHVKKHVFPKSEMTAFADEMCLTDKQFTMY